MILPDHAHVRSKGLDPEINILGQSPETGLIPGLGPDLCIVILQDLTLAVMIPMMVTVEAVPGVHVPSPKTLLVDTGISEIMTGLTAGPQDPDLDDVLV